MASGSLCPALSLSSVAEWFIQDTVFSDPVIISSTLHPPPTQVVISSTLSSLLTTPISYFCQLSSLQDTEYLHLSHSPNAIRPPSFDFHSSHSLLNHFDVMVYLYSHMLADTFKSFATFSLHPTCLVKPWTTPVNPKFLPSLFLLQTVAGLTPIS